MNTARSTAVVTVVTRSHFHRARCLLASVQRHLPDADCFAVLADADDDRRLGAQDFEVIPVATLPIPDVAGFVRRYRAPELCFATKPWALAEMLRRSFDRAIYFDADVVVYSSLQPMLETLDAASILLTPHLAEPPADGEGAAGIDIVRAGAYNAGFLALSRGAAADAFLKWWQRMLLHDCRVDVDRGYVGDQRWLDLVPGMFDGVHVVRHAGWNVGRWNLDRRPVTTVDGQVRVAGVPLVFFHYSGLIPAEAAPGQQRNPDAIAPPLPAVKTLVDGYLAELERHGARQYAELPFTFARSPAAIRATAIYRMKSSARHLLYAVTTTALRRRIRLWLRARAAR
jgi:hypothetical protein